MALQQQQQQTKRINSLSENPQSAPPPDIIFDILTRLPVESLLRFRSVSKLWCSIISDPHFIKSHLMFSTINTNRSYAHHHRLIFCMDRRISSCPLYDVLYDGSVNALDLDSPLKDYVLVAGSCNGLLLLTDDRDTLFVWNPSTRRSIRIPNYNLKNEPGCWREMYGFGYDEATDDYKVVGISSVSRHDSRRDTIVNIYSLKTGNWKEIDEFSICSPYKHYVKYLNGALHWGALRNSGWMIVSLDLAKETYAEILQPVYDEDYTDLGLGALGEWLCVLCDYENIRADLWVMKVYGVKDSWTKLVSIPFDSPHDYIESPCISNDGKILLQYWSKLVVYDSKDCSSSEIQIFDECLEVGTFVESLVSPISLRAGAGDNKADRKLNVKKAAPKGKAAKDPNKPKRPANAFFVFMKQYKEENPENKSVAAVGKAGGAKWKSMSDSEKAPFVAKADKRKKEYEKSIESYNKKLAGGGNDDDDSDKSKSEVNDEDDEGSDEEEEDD